MGGAPDKRQKAVLYVILLIILLGLLLVFVIPWVGAATPEETLYGVARACSSSLANVTSQMSDLQSGCGYAAWKIDRISEGYKLFTLSAFLLSSAVNAALVYWLVKRDG